MESELKVEPTNAEEFRKIPQDAKRGINDGLLLGRDFIILLMNENPQGLTIEQIKVKFNEFISLVNKDLEGR